MFGFLIFDGFKYLVWQDFFVLLLENYEGNIYSPIIMKLKYQATTSGEKLGITCHFILKSYLLHDKINTDLLPALSFLNLFVQIEKSYFPYFIKLFRTSER